MSGLHVLLLFDFWRLRRGLRVMLLNVGVLCFNESSKSATPD